MENTRKTPAFFDALNIAIPFLFMVAGGILFFVLPKKQISEIEKRKLASVPEYSTQALLEGSYTRELEAYVADNFPYRDQWIEFGGNMREWRGFRPEENIKLVATKQPQFLGQNPEDSAIMNSENEFVDGTSCQFLKAQQTAAPCPVGFSPYGPSPGTGATKDLSLFGCIDATKVCLHTSTMSRLQQLGYDTTGFVDCGTLG